MPRKDDDLDFKIFVDPSCLSDPMDDETSTSAQPVSAVDAPQIADIPVDIPAVDEQTDTADTNANTDAPKLQLAEPNFEVPPELAEEHHEELDAVNQHDASTLDDELTHELDHNDTLEVNKIESEDHEFIGNESAADESLLKTEGDGTEEPSAEEPSEHHDDVEEHNPQLEEEETQEESFVGDDAETPKPARIRQIDAEDDALPLQTSTFTDRKTSLRTEALIQAAARAVVAKLEKRGGSRDSVSQPDEEADHSLLSAGTQDTDGLEESQSAYDNDSTYSRRESTDSQIHHDVPSRSVSGDEGGDSSSHNEADDDVFSDRSARSSIGSFDGTGEDTATFSRGRSSPSIRQSFDTTSRSPRISGVSIISGLSQYDKDDFVPTSRETRIPFRTPSAVRAMQMASPTPSVFNGGSPRSGKRQTGVGSVPRSAHLHSPTVSAQYSPKGRSTPTRLKARKEAPLVLLHVTLLPLRWMWGDILNNLDSTNAKALDENKDLFEASEQLKTLRDAWRELQDCVGETILERGILIPHPQNDFEVLEERLLEALELPLRRRARILECGHYLGPANMNEDEYDESEEEYASESGMKEEKKHWCNTCKGDIKYEDLGPGKIFRVKVYASNGLMKAGAWEACWKDMERVDVEVEPIVEPATQAELEKLTAIQIEQEEQRRQQEAEAEAEAEAEIAELRRQAEREEEKRAAEKEEIKAEESMMEDTLPIPSDAELPYTERQNQSAVISSPSPISMQIMHASPPQEAFSSAMRVNSPSMMRMTHSSRSMHSEPMDTSEERRRRDEERLREIYGDVPPPQPYSEMNSSVHAEPTSSRPRHPDSYIPPPTPRSPSEEAWERRQQQRDAQRRALDDASFIELMLEAFKVLLRDSKNVAIIVLCLFLICLMIRPSPQVPAFEHSRLPYGYEAKQDVVVHTPAAKVEAQIGVQPEQSTVTQALEAIVAVPSVESLSSLVMATPVAALDASISSLQVESPLSQAPRMALDAPSEDVQLEVASEVSISVPPSDDVITIDDAKPITLKSLAEGAFDATALAEDIPDFVARVESIPKAAPEPSSDENLATTDDAEDTIYSETPQAVDDMEASTTTESEPMVEAESSPSIKAKVVVSEALASEIDNLLAIVPEPLVELDDQVTLVETDSSVSDASPLVAAEIPLEVETVSSITNVEESATTEPDAAEATHPCESYVQSARLSAYMAAGEAAPSSPVSHVFPVTERKTIRVYETITETVRVSVTATETASVVETAIPQTVEETVYETETVRITVSIPVDSVPQPSQARDEL